MSLRPLLAITAGFFFLFFIHAESTLPPLEQITKYGCEVNGTSDRAFLTHVWADYADGHKQEDATHGWIRLYSVRNDRSRALKDCQLWMKEVENHFPRRKKK